MSAKKMFCIRENDLEINDLEKILLKSGTNVKEENLIMEVPDQVFLAKSMDGKHTILVDVGCGIYWDNGQKSGHLSKALEEKTIKSSEITDIFISHIHVDHAGGLIDEKGEAKFKNATIHLSKQEMINIQESEKKYLSPYKDRIKTFKLLDGERIEGIENVEIRNAEGHTSGHAVFVFDNLMMVGDTIHHFGLQISKPEIACSFDQDKKKAVESRIRLLNEAQEKKLQIVGPHFHECVILK